MTMSRMSSFIMCFPHNFWRSCVLGVDMIGVLIRAKFGCYGWNSVQIVRMDLKIRCGVHVIEIGFLISDEWVSISSLWVVEIKGCIDDPIFCVFFFEFFEVVYGGEIELVFFFFEESVITESGAWNL